MKAKIFNILKTVFALGIIAGLGWLLFILVKKLIFAFTYLQKEVAAGIIAALVAIIISILSLIISKYYERKSEIIKEHREKKIPIYEELINFCFKSIFWEKAGEEAPTEKEIMQFLNKFTQKLITWGSDNVLKSFYILRSTIMKADPSNPPVEGLFLLEKLLLDMRKDLGHKNRNIQKGDILGLFIYDIKNYI